MAQQPPMPKALLTVVPMILTPPDGTTGLPVNGLRVAGEHDLPVGTVFTVVLVGPGGTVNPVAPPAQPTGSPTRWNVTFNGLANMTTYTCNALGVLPGSPDVTDSRTYQTA